MESSSVHRREEGEEKMIVESSPITIIGNDFISSRTYISRKIKNGKAKCDRCGTPFAAIHPLFVCLNDSDEELLCYPCNYSRNGTSAEEIHRSKRSDQEKVVLELRAKNNAATSSFGYQRDSKRADSGKKKSIAKEKPQNTQNNTPDLFSELI